MKSLIEIRESMLEDIADLEYYTEDFYLNYKNVHEGIGQVLYDLRKATWKLDYFLKIQKSDVEK